MPIERLFDSEQATVSPADLYSDIHWPEPPGNRPYVYINMASTADGKVVVGKPGGPSTGVGGPTDQLLFRRLQQQCDAAIVGSSTIRAGNVIYPPDLPRFTVTHNGDLPLRNRFFKDAPDRAFVFAPKSLASESANRISSVCTLVQLWDSDVILADALRWMREEKNIKTLLCEGGPTINDQLLRSELADELFLTLAPKLKGGSSLSTIVAGEGFPPGETVSLRLVSSYRDADELYLRYLIGSR